MKILVCISATPDTTSRIAFKNNDSEFQTDGIQYILNPYDEWYALVKALELKEKLGGTVTVIHVGNVENETMIRKALAIGADDAVRINASPTSSFFTAVQICEQARTGNYDLILTGKETIDYQDAEVGPMIAEILDIPSVTFGNKLEIEGNTAKVWREIEGGVQELSVDLPILVSAAKGMAEQRIPNMKGIMMAKSKPLVIMQPIAVENYIEISQYYLPGAKQGIKMVAPDDMDELVRLLHEEAKAL